MEQPRQSTPLVSVVIPTRLRPELAQAIRSARAQELPGELEVVVVIDVANAHEHPAPGVAELLEGVTVIRLDGALGAAAARNEGVLAARGTWIAFLDDDDEWETHHVASALEQAARHRESVVVATRAVQVVDGEPLSSPTPARAKPQDVSVGDYLFRRRSPSIGRPSLFTSTLVVEREVAVRVRWQTGLPRHQDWDWLLRLEAAGVPVVQCDAVTTRIWVGSSDSISASADWSSSLEWARRMRRHLGPRAYADFLAAQTLRYAVQARSWSGTRAVLRELVRSRSFPWPGSLVFAAGALLPRREAFRALVAVRRVVGRSGHGA